MEGGWFEMPLRKLTFEWMVVSSKGEDLCLTEKQFEFYKIGRENGVVSFDNFEINPSFVVKAFRRPVQGLFDLYPCHGCHKNGQIQIITEKSGDGAVYEECSICKGTGLDFNYVSEIK